jgi:ribosomal protein S18 acetylase RimI-like enzyme
MQIASAEITDIDIAFDLYEKAIEFQKKVFDKSWLGFDRSLVETEIAEKRLWKIMENGSVACIYTLAFADPMIWGADSGQSAMYIHRIVTNPDFRGRGYVRVITEWAKGFAPTRGIRFIRMDTWGDNQKLMDYYLDCGFKFMREVTPEESDTLPKHYRGIRLSLLEIDLQ